MRSSNKNNYIRYNRYAGKGNRSSGYDRGGQDRRGLFSGLVTLTGLLLLVGMVWFVAIKFDPGADDPSQDLLPSPTYTVQAPGPTDTPKPTPSPTFNELLAMEVKKHDRKPIVLIDPGHGFNSEGAMADGGKGIHTGAYVIDAMGIGRWEDFINLDIALKLRDILVAAGFEVQMTREIDACVQTSAGNIADLVARRNMANKSNADAFVSIHQNTVPQTDVTGTQVWCNSRWNEFSDELGNCLLDSIVEATGSRRIKVYDEFYKPEDDGLAIPKANKPTALIECGFMSNPEELDKLLSDEYQQKIAEGIATGLVNFFNTATIWKE